MSWDGSDAGGGRDRDRHRHRAGHASHLGLPVRRDPRTWLAINEAHPCPAGARVLWDLSPLSRLGASSTLDGTGYRPGGRLHLQVPVRRTWCALRSFTCAPDLADQLRPPIWGWFGQRDQFAMGQGFEPSPGVERFLSGTPPVLGHDRGRGGREGRRRGRDRPLAGQGRRADRSGHRRSPTRGSPTWASPLAHRGTLSAAVRTSRCGTATAPRSSRR